MKSQTPGLRHLLKHAVAVCGTLLATATAQATPYASGLTNTGTQVIFRLNEAADSVRIISNGGATTNELGALSAGSKTNTLTITGNFQVQASKSSGLGWTQGVTNQISADTNALLRFNSARGLAVNTNPKTPTFGRVYVANSAAGATTAGTPARTLGDGFYMLNPDLTDALGQGNTARTAGFTFLNTGGEDAFKPWRAEVGEDGNLYFADFSIDTGSIYVIDPAATGGTNVLVGRGFGTNGVNPSAFSSDFGSSVFAKGSLASSNLVVYGLEGDISPVNGLVRFNIGEGPLPYTNAPVQLTDAFTSPLLQISGVTVDLEIGPDGKFYLMQNRSAGNEPGVVVLDPNVDVDGFPGPDLVYSSLGATRILLGNPAATDILAQSRALKVSPDGQWLAVVRDNGSVFILPLVNGIPDLSLRRTLAAGVTLGRELSFDAAGNLYVLGDSQTLRVFSPGFATTTTTGTDGSFSSTNFLPAAAVSVVATDANAAEPGSDTGLFTITRTGSTSASLTVGYSLTGTAINGTDYTTNTLSVTIPAGQSDAAITITPINDSIGENVETVILTLSASTNYVFGASLTATVSIADDGDPAALSLASSRTNIYERYVGVPGTATFSRVGDTTIPLTINFGVGGSAVVGTDYIDPGTSVTIPVGAASATLSVTSIVNNAYTGDKTVSLTVQAGAGYTPGSSSNVVLVIRDAQDAPGGIVIYTDDFETNSASNYRIRFYAANGVADSTNAFNYDYSLDGIPPAPGGTSTRGAKFTVNKYDATATGNGSINAILTNLTVGGNFSFRFNLFSKFDAAAAGTTEHTLYGIFQSGTYSNYPGRAGSDGIWFAQVGDSGSASPGYGVYANATNTVSSAPTLRVNPSWTAFTDYFTSPPALAAGSLSGTWADVEILHTNNIVAWKINGVLINLLTNSFGWTAGSPSIGHADLFASIGSLNNFSVFDNIVVTQFAPTDNPRINKTTRSGSTVVIDFYGGYGSTTPQFKVFGSSTVNGTYSAVTGPVITQISAGFFRATLTENAEIQFYQIVRQ